MPWLADIARALEREPALLTAPCACCAANPCRCSAAYCRDTLACCLHCRCDRCTDARRYPQRDHRRDARRRIDSGAVWWRQEPKGTEAESQQNQGVSLKNPRKTAQTGPTLTHSETDGQQDQPQAARPGATSEPKEAPRATTSP